MSLKNKISGSNSIFTLPIKIIYYRLQNKYYDVNDFIVSNRISDDGYLEVTMKNGFKLCCQPSKFKADINFIDRYKFGNKNKMDKILDVNKYYFMYEVISEVFLNNEYFKYFELKEGDIVIDAGANIGSFAVQAAKKVGKTGKVYAIEPDPENIETLKRNFEINGLSNYEIVPFALWSEKCTKEFFISYRPGEHSLIENAVEESKLKVDKIQMYCNTLDNLIDEYGIKNIAYLKMDIEGAEIEALQGATKFLTKGNPFLYIEALHQVEGKPTYLTLVPFLKKLNYKIIEEITNYRGTIFAEK